ncbi:MAG TPA: hypothetical protein VFX19_10260 [Dehalococcoidia bacterium]|nr:hypothetical protein [Dehalococcoidia bacterium]
MTEIEPTSAADAEDSEWQNRQGEAPDSSALTSLQLAHRVIAKFPELTKRYQKFIGTAAVVSSALIVLASIAVSRRLHRGESAEQILASITPDEIVNAGKQKPEKPKNGDSDEERKKRRFLH